MALYLGVDGGGTSTIAWVAEVQTGHARIVGRGSAGASNHQTVGLDAARAAVADAIREAAGRSSPPFAGAVLGLAGADFPEDIAALKGAVADVLASTPFRVVNDADIALTAGLGDADAEGLLVLAGTGTNVFGRLAHSSFHIGGLGFPLGDMGGGTDLVRMALHRAFRAHEGRGPGTLLVDAVRTALGVESFEALARELYFGRIDEWALAGLAPWVFRLAGEGDQVCQDLLVAMGTGLGESAGAGVVRLLAEGARPPVAVVLAGSLWFGSNPLMLDAFTLALHRRSSAVRVQRSGLEPVVGALMMAVGDRELASRVRAVAEGGA